MQGVTATAMAGGIAVASGWHRESKFPANGHKAVIATVLLMVVTSIAENTTAGPVFRGLAYLLLMAAIIVAIRDWNIKKGKSK